MEVGVYVDISQNEILSSATREFHLQQMIFFVRASVEKNENIQKTLFTELIFHWGGVHFHESPHNFYK